MVGKYAYSKDVIHASTINANMVGLPSILRVEIRSLICCYGGVVFFSKIRLNNIGKTTTLNLHEIFSQLLYHQYRMTT